MFSSSKPKELLRKDKEWITDVGHNTFSWRHMEFFLYMQHITPNSDRWDYPDTPCGDI